MQCVHEAPNFGMGRGSCPWLIGLGLALRAARLGFARVGRAVGGASHNWISSLYIPVVPHAVFSCMVFV